MILGVGTDLCNIERIERTLERFGDRFRNRVFTDIEQAKAEVYARIADYVPRPTSTTGRDKRGESYVRLKQSLNQLHGSDC